MKEITAKLEGLGEEDLEIQEQIKELEKRLLDLCKRKEDKEAEAKELFEKLDTLNPLLAIKLQAAGLRPRSFARMGTEGRNISEVNADGGGSKL